MRILSETEQLARRVFQDVAITPEGSRLIAQALLDCGDRAELLRIRAASLQAALELVLGWKDWDHDYSTTALDAERDADYAAARALLGSTL